MCGRDGNRCFHGAVTVRHFGRCVVRAAPKDEFLEMLARRLPETVVVLTINSVKNE